jgi:hypothetical protein
MKAIETNTAIAEISNSILNIVSRKFTNLILDQMTEIKHQIHV